MPPPPLPSADRDRTERAGDAAERAGEPIRLRQLARAADLTDLDVEFLVAALAPDLDSRFERLYGYLNDDVTRRRATIGLVLELAGVPATSAAARARLAPGAPLLDHGLVVLDDASGPFLTRGLRVPDRVTSHLLGDDACDPALADVLCPLSSYDGPVAARLAAALGRGVRLVYLRDRGRRSAAAAAAAAVRDSGRPVLGLDLSRAAAAEADGLVPIAGREALLRGAGLVAGPSTAWPAIRHGPVPDGAAPAAPSSRCRSCCTGRRPGTRGGARRFRCRPRRQPSAPPTGSGSGSVSSTVSANPARRPPTCCWGRSRSPAPSGPHGCPAWPGTVRPGRRPCSAGPASRTRRAWSGWPGGSSPPSAGPTWCCPPP